MSLSTLLRSIGPEFLKHARKWPVGLAISLLVVLVLMGLGRMFLRSLESKSLDLRFVLLSPSPRAEDEIILWESTIPVWPIFQTTGFRGLGRVIFTPISLFFHLAVFFILMDGAA